MKRDILSETRQRTSFLPNHEGVSIVGVVCLISLREFGVFLRLSSWNCLWDTNRMIWLKNTLERNETRYNNNISRMKKVESLTVLDVSRRRCCLDCCRTQKELRSSSQDTFPFSFVPSPFYLERKRDKTQKWISQLLLFCRCSRCRRDWWWLKESWWQFGEILSWVHPFTCISHERKRRIHLS